MTGAGNGTGTMNIRWRRRLVVLLMLAGLAVAVAVPAADSATVVINAGQGGNNSRQLLARLERDVLAHRPDLVILMVGTNDVLNHANAVALEEFQANLTRLTDRIAAAGSRQILMTVPPCYEPHLLMRHPREFYGAEGPAGLVRAANEVVRRLSRDRQIPLVDVHALFSGPGAVGAGARSLLRNEANSGVADGVHPTAEGYRVIAEAVCRTIRDLQLPQTRIVCFGDSITQGAGVTGAGTATGETYPACLQQLLGAGADAR